MMAYRDTDFKNSEKNLSSLRDKKDNIKQEKVLMLKVKMCFCYFPSTIDE